MLRWPHVALILPLALAAPLASAAAEEPVWGAIYSGTLVRWLDAPPPAHVTDVGPKLNASRSSEGDPQVEGVAIAYVHKYPYPQLNASDLQRLVVQRLQEHEPLGLPFQKGRVLNLTIVSPNPDPFTVAFFPPGTPLHPSLRLNATPVSLLGTDATLAALPDYNLVVIHCNLPNCLAAREMVKQGMRLEQQRVERVYELQKTVRRHLDDDHASIPVSMAPREANAKLATLSDLRLRLERRDQAQQEHEAVVRAILELPVELRDAFARSRRQDDLHLDREKEELLVRLQLAEESVRRAGELGFHEENRAHQEKGLTIAVASIVASAFFAGVSCVISFVQLRRTPRAPPAPPQVTATPVPIAEGPRPEGPRPQAKGREAQRTRKRR